MKNRFYTLFAVSLILLSVMAGCSTSKIGRGIVKVPVEDSAVVPPVMAGAGQSASLEKGRGISEKAYMNRYALVIGTSQYKDGKIDNSLDDASFMASALRDLGFEVILVENPDTTEFDDALLEFSGKAGRDSFGILFFSGKSAHVGGDTYLMPSGSGAFRTNEGAAASGYGIRLISSILHFDRQLIMLDTLPSYINGSPAIAFDTPDASSDTGWWFSEKMESAASGNQSMGVRAVGEEIGRAGRSVARAFDDAERRVEIALGEEGCRVIRKGIGTVLNSSSYWKASMAEDEKEISRLAGKLEGLERTESAYAEISAEKNALELDLSFMEARYNSVLKEESWEENEKQLLDRLAPRLRAEALKVEPQASNARSIRTSNLPESVVPLITEYEKTRSLYNAKYESSWQSWLDESSSLRSELIDALRTHITEELLNRDNYGDNCIFTEENADRFEGDINSLIDEANDTLERFRSEYDEELSAAAGPLLKKMDGIIASFEEGTSMLSSLRGDLTVEPGLYDRSGNGWNIRIVSSAMKLGNADFAVDMFIPFDTMVSGDLTSRYTKSEITSYYDYLISAGVPLFDAEFTCRISQDPQGGLLFDPDRLTLRRNDRSYEGVIVDSLDSEAFLSSYGYPYRPALLMDTIYQDDISLQSAIPFDYTQYGRIENTPLRAGSVSGGYYIDRKVISSIPGIIGLPRLRDEGSRGFEGWENSLTGESYDPGSIVERNEFEDAFMPVWRPKMDISDVYIEFISSEDGDDTVSLGEEYDFIVTLRNSSQHELKNVKIEILPILASCVDRDWLSYPELEAVDILFSEEDLEPELIHDTVTIESIAPGAEAVYSEGNSFRARNVPPVDLDGNNVIVRVTADGWPAEEFRTLLDPESGYYGNRLRYSGLSILMTEDGDTIPERGEQVIFDVVFFNEGDSPMINPRVEFSTETPGVELGRSSVSWPRVEDGCGFNSFEPGLRRVKFYSGDYAYHKCFTMTIPEDFDPSEPLVLKWTFTSDNGLTLSDRGIIPVWISADASSKDGGDGWKRTVSSPNLVFRNAVVKDSESKDDTASAGEDRVVIDLEMENIGAGAADDITMTVTPVTEGVSVVSGSASWETVKSGEAFSSVNSREQKGGFVIKIDERLGDRESVDLRWSIKGSALSEISGIFTIPLGKMDASLEYVRTEMTSDTMDDEFNPGETVTVDVVFRNPGPSALPHPSVRIFSDRAGMSIIEQGYRNRKDSLLLEAGAELDYYAVVKVDRSVQFGSPVKLRIEADDRFSSGKTYFHEDEIVPVNAEIAVEKWNILATGSGDDKANPNEKIRFDIVFRNDGPSKVLNPKVEIYSSIPGITLLAVDREWPEFAPESYANYMLCSMSEPDLTTPDVAYGYEIKTGLFYSARVPIVIDWTITGDGLEPQTGSFEIPVQKK